MGVANEMLYYCRLPKHINRVPWVEEEVLPLELLPLATQSGTQTSLDLLVL
jgi:hypothetical protein